MGSTYYLLGVSGVTEEFSLGRLQGAVVVVDGSIPRGEEGVESVLSVVFFEDDSYGNLGDVGPEEGDPLVFS